MSLENLVEFAREWAGLGSAVQSQVEILIDNIDRALEECNPNAISLAEDRLRGINEDLDFIFNEWNEIS